MLDKIKSAVPTEEMLAGLAEEASELAQAALKLRRTYVRGNPTPVTRREAEMTLMEEIADVRLYLDVLGTNWGGVFEIWGEKLKRWYERLGGD